MRLKIPGSGKWFRQVTTYGTIGIEMGVCVFLGILFGTTLDKHFHTEPWLTIIFTLFGLIAGFKSLFTLVRKLIAEQERPEEKEDTNDGNQPR